MRERGCFFFGVPRPKPVPGRVAGVSGWTANIFLPPTHPRTTGATGTGRLRRPALAVSGPRGAWPRTEILASPSGATPPPPVPQALRCSREYVDATIFTHLKLWIASARHNFKWVKIQPHCLYLPNQLDTVNMLKLAYKFVLNNISVLVLC